MNWLARWRRWWSEGADQAPAEAEDEAEDDGQDQSALDPRTAKALHAFVRAAGRPLGEAEALRLANAVLAAAQANPGFGATECLIEGLVGDGGQAYERPLMLYVDWKDTEEAHAQLGALAARHGLDAATLPRPSQAGVAALLHSAGPGFDAQGLALLHIDPDGDAYAAALVTQPEAASLLALASEAGLRVRNNADFARHERVHPA